MHAHWGRGWGTSVWGVLISIRICVFSPACPGLCNDPHDIIDATNSVAAWLVYIYVRK